MKQVKYDGYKWKLLTPDGGFFNPHPELYFYADDQGRIAKIIKGIFKETEIDVIYEIPDSSIYTSVCGPKCGPFWPDANCNSCGGNGVGATFSDGYINMGSTDEGNAEIELIKQGKSNIHPEL